MLPTSANSNVLDDLLHLYLELKLKIKIYTLTLYFLQCHPQFIFKNLKKNYKF